MKQRILPRPVVIELSNISKRYEIHHEKPTLVEKFVKGRNETFWAIRNINLRIYKGERIAIIGPNGSGKTTLLKFIAGISTPTSGTVRTSGRVVSLIDLEAGFHPDLTGIQNIYLNGCLLGLKKNEIDAQLGNIINFAELHQFIDVPIYTYSQGMLLRLGFSIAIHASPDILVLDEGLGVGDKYFRQKSSKKIFSILKKNVTILMVAHQIELLKHICTKYVLMEKGEIRATGSRQILTKFGY